MRTCLAIVLMAGLAACGGTGSTGDDIGDDDDTADVFDPSVTSVEVEIDFETGDQPYTGPILAFGDTFDLLVANLERIFAGSKDLEIPTTQAEMENIGAVLDEELTVSDILALADDHRDRADAAGRKTYYVIFVSGNYADGDGVQEGVLGVSIGNTGVIAMFKDVVESTGVAAFPNLERYVEQSTLIHELGHAIGLVNNGVAMVSAHQDSEHGAHCNNDECVMYWLNEGASDAAMFARQYVVSGESILFGDECLDDVDALTGGP